MGHNPRSERQARALATATNPDLLTTVLEGYLSADAGELTNEQLYRALVDAGALPPKGQEKVAPVGEAGRRHDLDKRAVRWTQQTLKGMGLVERTDERGVWRLTRHTRTGLHEAAPGVKLVAFSTRLGLAVWGACESVLAGLDQPITLAVTSPPYFLSKQRAYGNPTDEQSYIDFLCSALEPVVAHLAPGGSICLNLPNDIFVPGLPARSMYLERLMIALSDRFHLKLMDRLVWSNPSRPPGPMQWASKTRQQLNAGYEFIYWFTNNPSRVPADNRRVLEAHTQRHLALMAGGGEQREVVYGDGAYRLRPGSYANVTPGRIPKNVITRGHRCADTLRYRADAQALGLPTHGAVQPISIPDFLIRFLSAEGDLVIDPFGGTVKTGMAAERLGRRWLVVEKMLEYLRASAERFRGCEGFYMPPAIEAWPRAA